MAQEWTAQRPNCSSIPSSSWSRRVSRRKRASRGTDEERMARSSGTRSRWAETRRKISRPHPGQVSRRSPSVRFGSPESDFP
ncbi:MAG: hypothetical protein H6R28_452 [Methanomicrobiales archaeon]|nr:hypothetical protein [Methanomicrobiales archaeon]